MGITQSIAEKQQEMMRANMDRQLRIMTATQMAYTRELIPWMATPYSLLCLGILGRVAARKSIPGLVIAPVVVGACVLGYQIDFAYGTKTERVRTLYQTILNDENHWFSRKD
jgi:hypothetical protein